MALVVGAVLMLLIVLSRRLCRSGKATPAAPNTILGWLREAAEHLEAVSRHFLRDLDGEQVQRDELCAWLRARKNGEVSARQAITRLSRSPHGGWGAMDPVCKWESIVFLVCASLLRR